MDFNQYATPEFRVSHDEESADILIIGLSHFGLSGLTAVDYLVDQLSLEETGHISVDALPSITPFEKGRPRHHTRLFTNPDHGLTVLVGELFVPVGAADAFSKAILEWTDKNEVSEITILSGIPLPHGPEDHRTFYIATDDYYSQRLQDETIPAMGMGFLDGVNASLIERGMDTELAVGILVTPVHALSPDVDAALRLLTTFRELYNIEIDLAPLETFASEIQDHYKQLSERLEAAQQHEIPEDRMYM